MPSASDQRELEISGLRAYPVREPVSKQSYTIVAIQTRSGLEGYGECRRIIPAELEHARQAIAGQAATAHEVFRQRLGQMPHVEAAINQALLDVVGKFSKAPVYQVLGGPTRNKARVLAPLTGSTDSDLLRSLEAARAAGHRAFLAPVPALTARNHGQAYVNATRKRLESLRAASGEQCDIVLDGGGALTPGDAASLAKALERFHLLWFDEPCALGNLGSVRKISSETVTPLGFGREIEGGGRYQDLLREEVVDILRPNLATNGITQIRKFAALAETYYVAVAPFHSGGPIASAAALHLAASLPNFFIQQIPVPAAEADRQMRVEIAGAPLEEVREGYAALPAGPGLGVNVNQRALASYEERTS
jgi:galactonate dehydratase